MKRTNESQVSFQNRITLTPNETAQLLGCGRKTAERIACDAGAVVRIGRRVLISKSKVEQHIESLAE